MAYDIERYLERGILVDELSVPFPFWEHDDGTVHTDPHCHHTADRRAPHRLLMLALTGLSRDGICRNCGTPEPDGLFGLCHLGDRLADTQDALADTGRPIVTQVATLDRIRWRLEHHLEYPDRAGTSACENAHAAVSTRLNLLRPQAITDRVWWAYAGVLAQRSLSHPGHPGHRETLQDAARDSLTRSWPDTHTALLCSDVPVRSLGLQVLFAARSWAYAQVSPLADELLAPAVHRAEASHGELLCAAVPLEVAVALSQLMRAGRERAARNGHQYGFGALPAGVDPAAACRIAVTLLTGGDMSCRTAALAAGDILTPTPTTTSTTSTVTAITVAGR